ncbi:hypothetical protein [Gordonia malaquae]|uniref:hypothetical protein n=1 Tax=Gordonia malaquae TaxID=410332 RepID=UPI0030FED1CA
MITIILLAAAIVVAVGGSALRSRRAADQTASDTSVLMVDFASASIVVILLIAGAIEATVADEVVGAELVAGAVLTVIAAAVTGSSVVRLVLAAGGIPTRADNHDDAQSGDVPPLRGGRIIGVLERTGVAACLLLGWPEGIPVILAVKSLARFSELRAPHASEQFILGTFASVLWSCAVAGIGYLLGT